MTERPTSADFSEAVDDGRAREDARRLFARECRFVAGAGSFAALPPETLPEIAFIGRSNVGKSSLINALTGRRMLARTSNTPGRTQQINFFDLGGRLMLVDLPGYGFAAASKGAIRSWTALVQNYLRARGSLRRTCLLVDARRGLTDVDRPVLALCNESALSFQVVLTKIDAVKPPELAATTAATAAELSRHRAAHPEMLATSAEKRLGIEELRVALAEFAENPEAKLEEGASAVAPPRRRR